MKQICKIDVKTICMSTLLCPFHLLKETIDSLLSKYGMILLFKNILLRDYNYDYS